MMMTMIMSMTTSLVFTVTKHPLSMGLVLIIQTLLVALTTGLMINMFWFSYILIISMLSGALVLFIYMASVASNEKFHTSMFMMFFILPAIMLGIIIFMVTDQMELSNMWSTSKKLIMNNDQIMTLIKLFNMHNFSITILLVSYLFLTMIAISYITNIHEGPLRMKS